MSIFEKISLRQVFFGVLLLPTLISSVLAVETNNIMINNQKYNLKVVYPHFSRGLNNLANINHAIDDCVLLKQKAYLRYVKAKINDFERKFIIKHSFFKLTYDTSFYNKNILSFIIFIDEVKYPTTHVNCKRLIAYNYFLNNEARITLSDCFEPGFDYVNFIHNYCYNEISENFKKSNSNFSPKALKDSIDETAIHNFQITPKAIIIYFNPNEIIPFTHGIQKVILPFDQMPSSQTVLKAVKSYY